MRSNIISDKINTSYKAVVIGGSAGSFQVVTKILSSIPEDFPLPIVLCLHRLKHVRNGFVEALSIKSVKGVVEPLDKESLVKGKVYLAPANYHLSFELGNSFALSTEDMINNSRPSIDVTFETAAYVFRHKVIGILLSGANKDGAFGMKRLNDRGGLTIVQDPEDCTINTMPLSAMKMSKIDCILSVEEIIRFLNLLYSSYKK
ncbi:chemotaxis protein CheB [Aureibacter tunicatorum]|uniref:protein-glutamate methylesterase n=1 Tax=Aureibacter tunicatorum TaxID=866807 RepID=A0AAE3XLY6_9BACT|nr:chemotaxis protein CheB [Aureibacter tunicatorum]MDR6239028.1 two-component system chemotaxis response regulator CheB [Aureibacter tunicatorum]BDD05046.1 putative chemotaxis protein-glutamate methylesterase [Aureibacter tunicatorum]